MTITREFDRYYVQLWGGTSWKSYIYCYKGNAYAGRMEFIAEGRDIPDDHTTVVGGQEVPVLHYSVARFSAVMEILRNEKPLYLAIWKGNKTGRLRTNREPIGEEEGAAG